MLTFLGPCVDGLYSGAVPANGGSEQRGSAVRLRNDPLDAVHSETRVHESINCAGAHRVSTGAGILQSRFGMPAANGPSRPEPVDGGRLWRIRMGVVGLG